MTTSNTAPVDPIVVLCVRSATAVPLSVATVLEKAGIPYLPFFTNEVVQRMPEPRPAFATPEAWRTAHFYVPKSGLEQVVGKSFEDAAAEFVNFDASVQTIEGHQVSLSGQVPDASALWALQFVWAGYQEPWQNRMLNLVNAAEGNPERKDVGAPDTLSASELEDLKQRFVAAFYKP